ncbi:MAG: hypothetical protein HUK02_10055, partial [Bacteroidaceae bacterium]|nr:hypothetical protein [Bacteroidaceae bacterium]
MKKLLFLALTLCTAAQAQNVTDITDQYLQNPSFELDDITVLAADATRGAYTAPTVVGWSLTGSYGVSDIMTEAATATDNNFGRPGQPSDGLQMYYLRNAWTTSTAQLQQTVTLPAGQYRLTLDNKCVTTSSHAALLTAAGEQTSLPFHAALPSAWTTSQVEFRLNRETAVTLGLT